MAPYRTSFIYAYCMTQINYYQAWQIENKMFCFELLISKGPGGRGLYLNQKIKLAAKETSDVVKIGAFVVLLVRGVVL